MRTRRPRRASDLCSNFGALCFNIPVTEKTYYSETFEAIGHLWQVRTERHEDEKQFAVFLILLSPEELPDFSTVDASLHFTLDHPTNPLENKIEETFFRFSSDVWDWGYQSFIALDKLGDYERQEGGVRCIQMTITVAPHQEISTGAEDDGNWSDSCKDSTGMVGLKNQGATCYMNSLLQTLYHLGKFRQAVYSLPTDGDLDSSLVTIPLALQRLFYNLQFGNSSVGTLELTKSFGWDDTDAFIQHDVQELNRVLCDNLENKMKGTCAEGIIADLFKGLALSYIKCIDIDFTSERKEEFYDISLNVRGCDTIYTSFDQYVEVEKMDGENKYMAEGRGLQAAQKGIKFLQFPPVLFIHLKRFEFDYASEMMTKINDRYDFPETLDLQPYSSEPQGTSPALYWLYSVLVHSGDVYSGHYYSFQRPLSDASWYRFDDDRVSKVSAKAAMNDNFGGEGKSNAYLLVYIRKSQLKEILPDPHSLVIPEHLKQRFEQERNQKEEARRRRQEAKKYVNVHIATLSDLQQYPQTPNFDLFDFDECPHRHFSIRRESTLEELHNMMAAIYDIPKDVQRFWKWLYRQNDTFRIARPFCADEEKKTIQELSKNKKDWNLFLEHLSPREAKNPLIRTPKGYTKNITLFFKFYDPIEQVVQLVGSHICSWQLERDDVETFILSQILQVPASLASLDLLLYEEVSPDDLRALSADAPLHSLGIESGDIIVFQISMDSGYGPTAAEFYSYFANRMDVEFLPLPGLFDDEDDDVEMADADDHVTLDRVSGFEGRFTLELSKKMRWKELDQEVSARVGCRPGYLRFTQSNGTRPKMRPLVYSENRHEKLETIVSRQDERETPILYYEVLSMPLHELETKVVISVQWQDRHTNLEKTLTFLAPRNERFEFIHKEIEKQVPLQDDKGIRIFVVNDSKIATAVNKSTPIVSKFAGHLVAEEVRPEEANKSPDDRLITVVHAYGGPDAKQSLRHFGRPFRCLSRKGEAMDQLVERISDRLQVPREEMAEWKYIMVSYAQKQFLELDDILSNSSWGAHSYLALHHSNPKGRNRRHIPQKSIQIYN